MKTIYKYPLAITDIQHVDIPLYSRILSVGMQGGMLMMWVMVDPEQQQNGSVTIRIFGTGHPIHSQHDLHFIGTVQDRHLIETTPERNSYGLFIWHVFEERM